MTTNTTAPKQIVSDLRAERFELATAAADMIEHLQAENAKLREPAKCALTALCGVQRAHGAGMHPSLAKDVEMAADGLREALSGKEGEQ